MMCTERKRVVLSPISRQSIVNTLINVIGTIGDGEEVEMAFVCEDNTDANKGVSKIHLDLVRKSKLPEDTQQTVTLTNNTVDVNISTRQKNKS